MFIGNLTASEAYKRRSYRRVDDQHFGFCLRKRFLTYSNEFYTMAVGSRKSTSIRNAFLVALVCFVVFFPSESSAQRAAVGIGSKLKGRFGMGSGRASRSGNVETALEGEQENHNNDRDGILLSALWTIAMEKTGISIAMLAFVCGYMYLFLQQSRIDEIEQALAAGEFHILAYLLVTKTNHMESNSLCQTFF